jgi:hypothetical protein
MVTSRVPSPVVLSLAKLATTPDTIRDLSNSPSDHPVVPTQQGIISWCISIFNRHLGFQSELEKQIETIESSEPLSPPPSYYTATQRPLQINDSIGQFILPLRLYI